MTEKPPNLRIANTCGYCRWQHTYLLVEKGTVCRKYKYKAPDDMVCDAFEHRYGRTRVRT